MSQKNDPRLIIFIATAIIVIMGVIILALALNPSEGGSSNGVSKITIESSRYDFGDVSMADGLVNYTFKFSNTGQGDLKISNISTSCMCTSAVLEVAGEKSPKFGMAGHGTNPAYWSTKIKPGDAASLVVTFDPNAHGPDATGPITRSVSMYSNDNGGSNVKETFTFTANVVK